MDKIKVKEALDAYVKRSGSGKKVGNELVGVSPATISQILSDKWELISDEMWRKVAAQIKYSETEWKVGATSVYQKLTSVLMDAQMNPKGIDAIIVSSSNGKSITNDAYIKNNRSVYFVSCTRLMNIRVLLKKMLKAMGKDSSGTSIEMMDSLVSYLQKDNHPLFIIDEVDKLKDESLELFIDLENQLHRRCGFVLMATSHFQHRIERGVERNKRGFTELYSRMKRLFWDLTPDKKELKKDCAVICTANGCTDKELISQFTNQCEGDFRVLTDLVMAWKSGAVSG